jgi:hypothetical protein
MCVVVVAIFIAAIGLVHSRGSDISPAPEPTEDVQDVPEPVAPEPVIPQFDNPYFHTGNVDEHNRAVIARLERCEALGLLAAMADPSTPLRSTEAEAEASAAGCGRNETTVILLASYWFRGAMAGNKPTGEIVYAQSTVSALNASGYALLFSSLGWMNHDMRRTTEWYRRWKDNVRLVLADAEQVGVCFDATQEGQKCVKTRENEGGIPAWKLLAWYYWDE